MSTKIDNFLDWDGVDADGRLMKLPAGLVKVSDTISGESGGATWPAYIFRKNGRTILAAGCRRFTLGEAFAHWGAVRNTYDERYSHERELHENNRRDRAYNMVTNVIPQAKRLAKRRGWRV